MVVFLWYWPGPAHGPAARLLRSWRALSTSALAYGASVAAGTYMVTGESDGWGSAAFFLVLSLAMALIQALELVETVWAPSLGAREACLRPRWIARQSADRHWPKGLAASRDLQRARRRW
jgi:hypothetical protein